MVCLLDKCLESYLKTGIYMNHDLITRLKQFMDDDAMSCSMDYGCMTPLYIYRMWGGQVALEDIENALAVVKKEL